MSIELRPITAENWRQAIKLDVREDQKSFVASNLYSIAESKFYPTFETMGIYADGVMVGFTMWGVEPIPENEDWWIIRLMIDKTHQGKGYGRAAMIQAIERLKAKPGCKAIFLSFEPHNAAAEKLYRSLGFENTGRIESGEIVYRLDLEAK